MEVDVEIYINNLIKFFKENPEDLLVLVPKEFEYEFYDRLKMQSYKNLKNGEEIILTKDQIIRVVQEIKVSNREPFQMTKIGIICLN